MVINSKINEFLLKNLPKLQGISKRTNFLKKSYLNSDRKFYLYKFVSTFFLKILFYTFCFSKVKYQNYLFNVIFF